MKQKNKVITKDSPEEDIYLVFFVHGKSRNQIYLAYNADIDSMCYDERPKIPGTTDFRLAKKYYTDEDARNDIYKLAYHHREFLNLIIGIDRIPLSMFDKSELLDIDTVTPSLIEVN